jgi:hypothetical protein
MKFCENFRKNRVKVGFGYLFWLRKQQFFLHMNFVFQKKNKMKVGFGCEKSSFFGGRQYENCGPKLKPIRSKSLAQTPRSLPFLDYVLYIFPMSISSANMPRGGKFWEKKLRKSHKNQKQNFWRKMLRKSYFLKKKHFLILL